jgi:PAS domain S-box-containing protein
MKFSINYKIFILVTFGLVFSILLSSFIYFNSLKNLAKDYAFQDLNHDISILTTQIKSIEERIDTIINLATNNSSLMMSINLISNYQEKDNYNRLIFDNEKKKFITAFQNILGEENSWAITIFDKDADPIAFKRKKKEKVIFGYTVYKDDKVLYYDKNDKWLKNLNPRGLDKSILNYFDIFSRKNEFVFKKAVPLKYNDQIIGYIRVGFILNQNNYQRITTGTQHKSIILSEKLNIGSKDFITDYQMITTKKEQTLLECEEKFVTYKKLKSVDDIILVAFSNTDKLNKTLYTTLKELVYISILIIVFFLVLSILFSNYFIQKPLFNLLAGINELKIKNRKQIKINSNDEISVIANAFNEMSKELSESFKSVQNSNLLLENILNTVHVSVFIKDIDGVYIKANKKYLDDIGFENESELLGKTDFDIIKNKKEAEFFRKKDLEVISSLKPQLNFEEVLTKADGKVCNLVTSKMPLIDSDSNIIGVLVLYEDVTDAKKKEKALKDKEAYLLQQSRLTQMGEMISMIAHQWRQPLAAISSTANSMILKNMMGQYEKEFFGQRLNNISEYSQHLSSTIDDFRNFFKKTKEKKDLTLESVVEDSLKIIQINLENKNIEIKKEFSLNETINSFPNELRQVVLNLIKNAEDILEEKDIESKWIKIKTYKENDLNVLEVSDNAGGIPDDIIEKIFEPYFSTKQNRDGTGLGLYMSKSIIEEHCSGKLSVTNDKYGAIFKVEL